MIGWLFTAAVLALIKKLTSELRIEHILCYILHTKIIFKWCSFLVVKLISSFLAPGCMK